MNPQFTFVYQGITDEQFAVYPEHYRLDVTHHNISTQIRFLHKFSTRQIGCELTVDFMAVDQAPFLRCAIVCMFQIDKTSWAERLSKEKDFTTIEEGIFLHFAAFTVGTLRGVLHVRQQNKTVNATLPPVNVFPLIKDMTEEERIIRAGKEVHSLT